MVQQNTLKKSTAPYGVKRENGAILSEGHTRCLSLCMKNPKRNYPPRMNSFPTFPLDACSCSKENKIPSGKKSSDKQKTQHTAATGRKKGKRRNKKHKEKSHMSEFLPYSPAATFSSHNSFKRRTYIKETIFSSPHRNTSKWLQNTNASRNCHQSSTHKYNLNLNRSFSPSLSPYVPLSQKISESSFVSLVLPGFRIRV
jgi:hypothetical protein